MKNPWVIIGIIIVVVIGGSIVLSGSVGERNNEGVVTGMTHSKGNKDASVVLVEYSDFQCPACAAFQPVLSDALERFGDSLNFEYKHFPLPIHSFAEQAARAAEAAGQQGKFFEFHDKVFAEQAAWSKSVNPSVFFVRYATELGLDVDQFTRQMKSSALRDEVSKDRADGTALKITGTPTFFLNGEKMDIKTYDDFITQIAAAIDPNSAASSTNPTAPAVKFGI